MRRSGTCSACAGKDEKCQTVKCSLALFLCLEDAFIVFGDSVQTDNKSDNNACKGDDLANVSLHIICAKDDTEYAQQRKNE